MVTRTFFNKTNTIIYNSYYNTGLNPVAELYYGGLSGDTEYTRHLFQFDVSRLQNFYTGSTYPDLSKLTHTLRMTNTGSLDKKLLGKKNAQGKDRSTSFDLILFPITQYWDSGVGYDYQQVIYLDGDSALNTIPSNWFSATTLVPWAEEGVITGETSGVTIATQHFELGNENLEMDITEYVNGLITGDTNYGLVLAYEKQYEELATLNYQYVGFFTNHTQSMYEPFVETTYSDYIQDDRNNFFLDKDNKLYLYVNLAGNPTNLDAFPTVGIYDEEDILVSAYTQSAITQITKGVYSINVNIPTTADNIDSVMLYDVWSGITINGVSRPPITLDFALKDSSGYYNIGSNNELPRKVGVTASGINRGEKIKRGDIKKVVVQMRIPFTVNQEQMIDSAQYRIYVKEGNNELTVVDFEPIEMANNHNYFLIDTASLLPETYFVDIKVSSNLEVTTLRDVIYFDILSESNLRESQ